jgi:aminoglycoside phosphotransferase family enzyme/predicted kinase
VELNQLIEALGQPEAYPHAVNRVEVRQTHISVVFLAGEHVYKIKKPVNLGFVDFTTLERRRHFCEEEVRLNRRLAPTVYQGVVRVTRTATGVQVGGAGEVVEWAVQMERLPDEARLGDRLRRGEIGAPEIEALARRVASFHAAAQSDERTAGFGRFMVVAGNARENFTQAAPQVGNTVSPAVFDRLRGLTEEALTCLHALIDQRAAAGVPRDTHGDLHLDHVYSFPQRQPSADLVIIDCIEFNERFRFADPVADMAFLVMDLLYHGRKDLAELFTEAYFQAGGDTGGRPLLPFYIAYRAVVRAKVEGLELTEKEIPQTERAAALGRARAHWLLALGELEQPGRRPCLVLVGGLPGSGKSTLAQSLAGAAGIRVIRSDVMRKELAGVPLEQAISPATRERIYAPEWSERTYAECLRGAEQGLFAGERVLVDANFREEARRRPFLDAAARWAVPVALLVCRADPEVVRRRLEVRVGDASDADWTVYQSARADWQEPGPETQAALAVIDSSGSPQETLAQALECLRRLHVSG